MTGTPKILPAQPLLIELLRYDFDTGALYWRQRGAHLFRDGKQSAAHACAKWNSLYASKEALCAAHPQGYRYGAIFGRNYLAHRVIWCLVTGDRQACEIDHINGVRSDNRWTNLREVDHAGNCRNMARRSDNTSGVTGVSFHQRSSRWIASIVVNGADVYLGAFDEFNRAVSARKAAERALGFHPNHGRA